MGKSSPKKRSFGYITVRKKDLGIYITPVRPKSLERGYPVSPGSPPRIERSPIADMVLYDHLYPARYAADRRLGRKAIGYCLCEPDPWLVALAMVMWEGIVQGVTWDVIKLAANQGLQYLRERGLAPKRVAKGKTKTWTSEEKKFRYVEYATNGRKRRELYLSLRRKYEKQTQTPEGKCKR